MKVVVSFTSSRLIQGERAKVNKGSQADLDIQERCPLAHAGKGTLDHAGYSLVNILRYYGRTMFHKKLK